MELSIQYSFGHFAPKVVTEFLQIHTNATQQRQQPLEITKDHLLFAHDKNGKTSTVPAGDVKVGDFLVSGNQQGQSSAAAQVVVSIQKVQRSGAYAPFTTSGDIVVNGVAASNYIAFPPAFQDYLSHHQQHWIQHAAFTPYRLHCGLYGCETETYDDNTGLSKAVASLLPALRAGEAFCNNGAHLAAAIVMFCCFVWKLKTAGKTHGRQHKTL